MSSSSLLRCGVVCQGPPGAVERHAMVLRRPVWLVPVGLLAVGLRPTSARVLPLLVVGRNFSPGRENGASQDQIEGAGSSLRQRAMALRVGGGGQSCSSSGGKYGRRVWGLNVVSIATTKRFCTWFVRVQYSRRIRATHAADVDKLGAVAKAILQQVSEVDRHKRGAR